IRSWSCSMFTWSVRSIDVRGTRQRTDFFSAGRIKDLIGHGEGVGNGGVLGGHAKQVLVRDDKQRIHHQLQLQDAGFGKAHAALALEVERLGDHANGEDAKLTRCPTGVCPLWVKSRHLHYSSPCPLYPQKRTFELLNGTPRGIQRNTAVRGRIILISVNWPGCVSTSIEPPCCLTIMSWLMERPRPVPSPAGFVVKNGLNIFSFTSGGIPVPLSRIVISTRSPRLLVAAARIGS